MDDTAESERNFSVSVADSEANGKRLSFINSTNQPLSGRGPFRGQQGDAGSEWGGDRKHSLSGRANAEQGGRQSEAMLQRTDQDIPFAKAFAQPADEFHLFGNPAHWAGFRAVESGVQGSRTYPHRPGTAGAGTAPAANGNAAGTSARL